VWFTQAGLGSPSPPPFAAKQQQQQPPLPVVAKGYPQLINLRCLLGGGKGARGGAEASPAARPQGPVAAELRAAVGQTA
jgi:hypothetical protein